MINNYDELQASKLLSIVISCRNDDYMPDFIYRITITINYIAHNLNQLGRLDDVEIVVVDWGSVKPISEMLNLLPEAANICRFLYVSPSLIRELQDGKDDFNTSVSINAGIRRASGSFIMIYPCDLIMTNYSLEKLLNLIGCNLHLCIDIYKTYFLLTRYRVPADFIDSKPSTNDWDRYLFMNESQLDKEHDALLSVSGGAGAIMAHRALWYEIRGLDERLSGWGWNDNDIGLRLTQKYPWVGLDNIGITTFHMEHGSSGQRVNAVKNENPHIYNIDLTVNGDNWGMKQYELETQLQNQEINIRHPMSGVFNSSADRQREVGESLDIIEQLKSDVVLNYVKKAIISVGIYNYNLVEDDIYLYIYLAWHAIYRTPRRYIDYGMGKNYSCFIVASLLPSLEIYGIDNWQGILYEDSPQQTANVLRRKLNHRGYIRFVNGDATTALERLKESFIGNYHMDLVLICENVLHDRALDHILDIIPDLSDGGAIIIKCNSNESCCEILRTVKHNYPEYIIFYNQCCNIGMVLKESLKIENIPEETYDISRRSQLILNFIDEIEKLKQTPPLHKRVIAAVKKPQNYISYAKRALVLLRHISYKDVKDV